MNVRAMRGDVVVLRMKPSRIAWSMDRRRRREMAVRRVRRVDKRLGSRAIGVNQPKTNENNKCKSNKKKRANTTKEK